MNDTRLDAAFAVTIHDRIIAKTGGLPGLAGGGLGGVEAALHRVETYAQYEGLDDVFDIAAMYAEAITRGHVFNDGNKRTALTCALSYLEQQGVNVKRARLLEEMTVWLAAGEVDRHAFAWLLWRLSGRQRRV